MSQFDTVKQAKALHQAAILSRPNVVGVGIGYKMRARSPTEELGMVVLVRYKMPLAALTDEAVIPQELSGIRTDVVEVGDLRPLNAQRNRWRPAPGGVSLGHYKITAGTLGCVVHDRRNGERLILSNNHILANRNDAQLGDPILQPGPADGGQAGDQIARLERFQRLRYNTTPATCGLARSYVQFGNYFARMIGSPHEIQALRVRPTLSNVIDAAVATPLQESWVLEENLQIGAVDGHQEATLGQVVCKSGRTTGFTRGTITVLDATVTIQYDQNRAALFEGQIVTTPMSQGGDSGSLLVECEKNQAVGLLFAGSDRATLHNPIVAVLDAMQVNLPGQPQAASPASRLAVERAQTARQKHETDLLAKANVVGVGVGLRRRGGQRTDQVGLVVMVQHKLPAGMLAPEDLIPSEIDGVPVDVRETGRLEAL